MKHSPKFLFVLLLGVFAAACQLAVDFDRSKIATESMDSSVITPANTQDTGVAPTDAAKADAASEVDAAPAADAATTVDSATAPADAATTDAA